MSCKDDNKKSYVHETTIELNDFESTLPNFDYVQLSLKNLDTK